MKETFDHIDDLIGKCLSGEASAVERTQVEEWIAISDSNKAHYDHFKLIFDKAKSVNEIQSFDVDAAWLKVKSKMHQPARKQVAFSPYFKVLKVAAVLLVAIGLGWITYQQLNTPDQTITLTSQTEIVRDTLPDGSRTVLNKSSTIKYAYNKRKGQRKVELEGEAFFEVKHAEAEPFIIRTGDVIIEDIGTTFNVLAFPESPTIEVYVESGEVAFYTLNNAGLNLVAGETGVYHKQSKSFARIQTVNANQLAYKTGVFSFRNADLETIVGDLNAVYDTKIRLGNDAIKTCLLNVTFRNERIEDIVEIIAETLKLTLTKEGEVYILNGTGCGD
ncbi:MAG: FecR domain-containing protein [Cyclobacteriaceae bacterium]|nr:FecR domain-containing protein [Cyclobacteriaceae bacterium]